MPPPGRPCRCPNAAKVRGDHEMLHQLTRAVSKTKASYELLQTEHRELAVELQAAEQERAALAAQFASKAAALDDLEARHQAACAYGKQLQDSLDASAAQFNSVVQTAHGIAEKLAEQVGAGCLGGVVGAGFDRGVAGRAQHPQPAPTCSCPLPQPVTAPACPPACCPLLATPLQEKLKEAAEGRATQLGADLAAVRQERDSLAAQLAAGASQLDQLKEALSSKSTQLQEVQHAKVGTGGQGRTGSLCQRRRSGRQQPICRQSWESMPRSRPCRRCSSATISTHYRLLQEGLEARLKEQEAAAAQLVATIAGLQAAAKTAEVGAGGLAGWGAGWEGRPVQHPQTASYVDYHLPSRLPHILPPTPARFCTAAGGARRCPGGQERGAGGAGGCARRSAAGQAGRALRPQRGQGGLPACCACCVGPAWSGKQCLSLQSHPPCPCRSPLTAAA